jgi:hypothetical protein
LQGHEVVAKSAKKRRDHHEEHHQDAVTGDQNIPKVTVGRTITHGSGSEPRAFHAHILHTRLHELHPHVDGEGDGNETGQAAGQKVKDTNIFMIGGHEPTCEETAVIFVVVSVYGCIGHQALPFIDYQNRTADSQLSRLFLP